MPAAAVTWSVCSEEVQAMSQAGLVREIWAFLRVRKKWWLAPLVLFLFLLGALLVFAQTSVLAPFIYTIF